MRPFLISSLVSGLVKSLTVSPRDPQSDHLGADHTLAPRAGGRSIVVEVVLVVLIVCRNSKLSALESLRPRVLVVAVVEVVVVLLFVQIANSQIWSLRPPGRQTFSHTCRLRYILTLLSSSVHISNLFFLHILGLARLNLLFSLLLSALKISSGVALAEEFFLNL